MPKNKSINLLPQEEFNASTAGRILKWATSTFRIIVIITEMIVMAAFISRFWLDAENSKLNSSIKIKSGQISAQTDLESQFRNIQSKLSIFSQIQQKNNMYRFITSVAAKVPQNIILSQLSVTNGEINIKGISTDDNSIAQFITNLNSGSFKKVNLEQVSSSESDPGQTVFSIGVTY